MAGLLDFLPAIDSPEGMGLLQFIATVSPKSRVPRGMLAYGQTQVQAKDAELKRGLLEAQVEETRAQARQRAQVAAAQQAEAERQQAIQRGMPGLFRQPGMTGGEAIPQEVGGQPMFSQPMGAAPMQQSPGGFDLQRALAMRMTPDEIAKAAALANIGRPKVARTVEVMRNGKPTLIQLDESGQEVGAGYDQWKAPVMQSLGNRVAALDPVSLQERGSMQMGQSPDSVAANRLGWANHGLSAKRLAFDQNGGGKPAFHDGQFVYPPSAANPQGGAVPVPGFTKPPKDPSEGERKAATLLQRLNGSQQQLTQALADKPDAASPGVVASGLRSMGAESFANYAATSSERQRVEAAQLDMLDAALTLGTGAAYTREQLEGYRKSYFPQIGDSDKNISDKQDRLNNVIEAAKIAAGRAGAELRPRANPNAFADPGKESRYQQWKRSQGK